jgi:hypothetical protein
VGYSYYESLMGKGSSYKRSRLENEVVIFELFLE